MKLWRFVREVATASYYRNRPLEAARLAYAKWLFSRRRVNSPGEFLQRLDVDPASALAGLERWRGLLEQTVASVQREPGQHGAISMQDGVILFGLVRLEKPDTVVETGLAAGVSTAFLLAGLIENGGGALYSIELPADRAGEGAHADGARFDWPRRGAGWAIPEAIRNSRLASHHRIEGDARTALPALLARLPGLDLFFHDDLHTPPHMLWEYETVWPKLRPNGWLVSDDSNFGWIRFCRNHGLDGRAYVNLDRLTAARKS